MLGTGQPLEHLDVYIELLLVATLIAVLTDKIRLPYTIGLVLVGLAVGITGVGPDPAEEGFSEQLIFFVLLPPLLFQGALHMQIDVLKRHFWPIATFAILGVTVSVFLLGGIFGWLGGVTPFLVAMLFGAMMSPTDPVSVLAIFKTSGVSHDLRHLVEGESLFNDGTGVVIFGILFTMIKEGTDFAAVDAVWTFVKVSFGGLALGAILGYVTFRFIRRTEDHLLETSACLVLAMGSFYLAEKLHLSGVMATVAAGLLIGNHERHLAMSEKGIRVVDDFFEILDFIINSVLFLMIGLEIKEVLQQPDWQAHLPLVGAGIVALLVARAIVVYPFHFLLNLRGTRRPWSWAHVLFWGGLRGSIPIALLLSLPKDAAWRDDLLVAGFGVVLFSLVVQGLTVKPLLKWLKLTGSAEETH